MTIVDRARAFATKAHHGQKRKYTNEPYIVHPEEVAQLVADHGGSESAIAAAWLHDVVEDCGVTREQLVAEFGDRVASLVMQVTNVSKPEDGNRLTRKALDRDHLAGAEPEAQSIKLADLVSNTASIVERDPDFAKVYLQEKEELLDVLDRGNCALWLRAKGQCRGLSR